MRKKLLALLMCATMVLGTGVTAFAATSDKEAKAIGGDNAQLIIDEYYKAAGSITGTASNGKNGSVTYGYAVATNSSDVLGEYTPVVIYSKDGKDYSATKVYSNGGKLKAWETKDGANGVGNNAKEAVEIWTAYTVETVELKNDPNNANSVPTDGKYYNLYSDNSGKDVKRIAEGAPVTNGNKVYDKDGNVVTDFQTEYTGAKAANAVATTNTAKITGDVKYVATTVYDDLGNSTVVISDNTNAEKVDGFVDGTKNYVKKDSGLTLVTGSDKFLKSVDETKYGKIYSQLSKAGEDFVGDGNQSVKYAIDSKKFTKDAAAVKISAYVQIGYATESLGLETETALGAGKAKALYNYTQLQAGSYTFDADLISRTAFGQAEAVAVFQPGIGNLATEYVADLGTTVVPFNEVATVAVDDTIKFNSDITWADGIFVFDKGELAAEEPTTDNNDGVSDAATTAAATNNTSPSPKTGDVAPIAALAVVMMGACGAMVVASKKRA